MEHSATPADYKIVHLEGGDFTDQNGNVWINVLFEGYTNEPIKWVVKDMSKYKVGDVVYGHFETKQSKAGKDYLRFYRDQRQQGFGGGQGFRNQREADDHATSQPQGKYPRDDHTQESIARSVALKAAVDLAVGNKTDTTHITDDGVLATAETFLAWLQGSSESTDPKATSTLQTPTDNESTSTTQTGQRWMGSGYDKFKAKGAELQRDERDEFNDARAQYQEPSYGDGSPLPEYQGDM